MLVPLSANDELFFTLGFSVDADGDGVSNIDEQAGPNGGDTNGDGIPDFTQQNVSGTSNPVTGGFSTLESIGSCEFINENAFLAENTLSVQDSLFNYPIGLVDFQVLCQTP